MLGGPTGFSTGNQYSVDKSHSFPELIQLDHPVCCKLTPAFASGLDLGGAVGAGVGGDADGRRDDLVLLPHELDDVGRVTRDWPNLYFWQLSALRLLYS